MVIQNYRDIKARSKKLLSYTPWDVKRIALVYGGIPLGVQLLLTVIDMFLNNAIGNTGGLAGLQLYSVLETASIVLNIGFSLFQLFWTPAIVYCALMLLREQNPWPNGLMRGFKRWSVLVRYTILLSIIVFFLAIAAYSASAMITAPFLTDLIAVVEQMPADQTDIYAYLESMDPLAVLRMIAPTMVVYVVLLIGIMIPIYYRLRLTQLLILDDDQIGARMAMHHSIVLTKGSCLQLFLLDLSFWWYHLLLGIAGLIPMASLLPVFAGLNPVFVNLLLTIISCVATLGVYMLGLMKVQTCNAIAYDQLRTAPKTEVSKLPEEEHNG